MLVLVGTLGAFAGLFSARTTLDRLIFESSLDYRWSGASPARVAGALNLTNVASVDVSKPSLKPSGGSRLGDLEHSRQTPAFVVDDQDLGELTRVFSAVLVAGSFDASGVAVDEGTASLFNLALGDSVIVSVNTESSLIERSFPIVAIILPHESNDEGAPEGLTIVPRGLLTGSPTGSFEGGLVVYSDHPIPGAQSRAERICAAVFGGPEVAAFVLVVLALGVAMWILGNVRFCSELLFRLRRPALVLHEIGSPPWKTLVTCGAVAFLTSGLAGCTAVASASWLITSWTHYFIQIRVAVLIAGVLMIPSFVVLGGLVRAYTFRNPGRGK